MPLDTSALDDVTSKMDALASRMDGLFDGKKKKRRAPSPKRDPDDEPTPKQTEKAMRKEIQGALWKPAAKIIGGWPRGISSADKAMARRTIKEEAADSFEIYWTSNNRIHLTLWWSHHDHPADYEWSASGKAPSYADKLDPAALDALADSVSAIQGRMADAVRKTTKSYPPSKTAPAKAKEPAAPKGSSMESVRAAETDSLKRFLAQYENDPHFIENGLVAEIKKELASRGVRTDSAARADWKPAKYGKGTNGTINTDVSVEGFVDPYFIERARFILSGTAGVAKNKLKQTGLFSAEFRVYYDNDAGRYDVQTYKMKKPLLGGNPASIGG